MKCARRARFQKITPERKLGLGEYEDEGPIVIGTAFFDRGRCLPWAMETPCVVCEEVCPVSPKAIGTYDEEITRWDGVKVTLNKPYMRPELCIGCGLCERECPVVDSAAVYVTAVGETRSKDRSLLLGSDKKTPKTTQVSHPRAREIVRAVIFGDGKNRDA